MSDDHHKPAGAALATIDAAALGDRYVLLERTDAASIERRILDAQRLENAALEARLLAAQDRAIAERFAPRGGRLASGRAYARPGDTVVVEPRRRYSAATEVRREMADLDAVDRELSYGGASSFGLRRTGFSLMGVGLLLMVLAWMFGAGAFGPGAPSLADVGYSASAYADSAAVAPEAFDGGGPAVWSLADSSPQMFGLGLLLLIAGAVATLLAGPRRGGPVIL